MKSTKRPPTSSPPVSRPIRNRASGRTASGKSGRLVGKANRWRDSYNPLRALDIPRAVSLLEAGQRGDLADLQWAYRSIERRNAVCRSLIVRRASALLKLDWDVKVPEELPPGATPAMADAQRKTLRAVYDRIDNLRQALRFLALAEFRGYAHLQIQDDGGLAGDESILSQQRLCLYPLHQWQWVRDGSDGAWGWNPEAGSTSWPSIPEERRADPEAWGLIIREVDMPLNEIALITHVRKGMSQKDWDAFIEIYGIPGGVVTMPPMIPDGKEAEYEQSAVEVAEGGSGAIPYGSEYKPNDSPRGVNPFRDHIRYQDEELVLAGTGGKLTMLTESGSGTLAGSAHQSAFDDIAEGEAHEISEVMQRQFDRRVLGLLHPGQPQCAYWELAAEPNEDTDKLVERVVKLEGAGFRTSAEEVSERTGLDLTRVPEPTPVPGMLQLTTEEPEVDGSAPFDPDPDQDEDPDPDDQAADPIANADRPGRPGLEAAGVQQMASALRADLAPFARRLAAIEGISDPEVRRVRLEALLAEWDALEADVLADPEAAQVIARVQGAAMVEGLTERRPIRNNEQPGHPFRGNQHTGGMGGGGGEGPSAVGPSSVGGPRLRKKATINEASTVLKAHGFELGAALPYAPGAKQTTYKVRHAASGKEFTVGAKDLLKRFA